MTASSASCKASRSPLKIEAAKERRMMTHDLALLLFIVAQNKSNSLEIGEVNTLSSSHTSWAILDQPTLVWHDSALILDRINWFTTQCGFSACRSIKSNECSWAAVFWWQIVPLSRWHRLSTLQSRTPPEKAPPQSLDRYQFKFCGKKWEISWLRDEWEWFVVFLTFPWHYTTQFLQPGLILSWGN